MLDVIPGLMVLPLPILWLLILGGILWRWKRLSRAAFAVATVLFVVISLPASGKFLISTLADGAPPYEEEGLGGAQAILVPSGGTFDDGAGRWWPTSSSAKRLALGLQLRERLGLPLIISGGSPKPDQPPEAKTLAEHYGLRAPQVLLELTARNTSETAEAVAAMLIDTPEPRVILVTSSSHITRMSAALRHYGVEVLAVATAKSRRKAENTPDYFPSSLGLKMTRAAFWEYMGIAWYLVTDRLDLRDL
jgi:uncharacterized SAM-binding protein YcdF (DUF218 family)